MFPKIILLPDSYPLVGVVSVASTRAILLEAREGHLARLRDKYQSTPSKLRFPTGFDGGNDPAAQILLQATIDEHIDLLVGDHRAGVGHKISRDALCEYMIGFCPVMSLTTGKFCVVRPLMFDGSLEAKLSGMPIWTPSNIVNVLKLTAPPSTADILRIGRIVIGEHATSHAFPILPDLWCEICERVKKECGGCPSPNHVEAIVGPSVPKAWRKRGPKRGRGPQAGEQVT